MHLIYAILWTARRLLQLVLSYGLHSVLCIFSCINLHDLWSACISSMLSYRLHVAYCIPMNCTQLMQHPWGGPYRPHAAYAATQTFVPYAITRCLYATIAYAITRCLCNHCSFFFFSGSFLPLFCLSFARFGSSPRFTFPFQISAPAP